MNKIKFTSLQIFVAAFLLCGLMTIQTPAAPMLQANGKIAFTSDRDGNSEIYLMNADGSGQTRLTNNSFSDDFPTWSPDGRTIAFLRQSGGVFSINVMNADGTNVRQITTLSPVTNIFGMSWSPDGTRIAFEENRNIFTINADGSNRVNLTNGQNSNYGPSWSPDGSRIAFARFRNYASSIHTMNADGSDVRQITPYCQSYFCSVISPDWSPDGGRIAFKSDGKDDPSGILLVNPDGTNLQINPWGIAPKWSPDGTKIVFYIGGYSNIPSQIWVMNRNGSGLTQLTNAFPNNFNPDWQPLTPELGLIVTRSDDRNNSTCVPGDCSLREAVNAANASATDDTINFASGLTRITLTNEIVINNAGKLTINGPGANILTIDGGAGTNRVFYINQAKATISGVTLTGGNGMGSGVSGYGGAIYARIGFLTLDGVHVAGNAASFGGGLFFLDGTNFIINSTISGNTAYRCGGLENYSTLTIVNSTISGNTATSFGGGFCHDDYYATLRNVTITNNTAGTNAGGIWGNMGALDFGNTIVAGNTASSFPEILPSYGPNTSAGGNLVGDSPGDSPNTGIIYQPTDIRDTNPLLGALANNGGTTPTHALSAGSPLIDKGLNALVSPLAVNFDQRGTGFARIRDGDGNGAARVDIGAFEVQLGTTAIRATPFDFDGDGKADLSVFRPSDRIWYLNRSTAGFSATQFGLSSDKITPADFDGDGKTDISVYRDGTWYWLNSSNGSFQQVQFGLANDIPQPADFDGDGRAELAIYRGGTWWTLNLTNNQVNTNQFGIATDKPVAADYDGDGRADQAIYRNGEWHLNRSSQGYAVVQFGLANDRPVIGDYDGDGKADEAVYRNGTWYILQSSQGFTAFQFGLLTDIPAPADYDGDGKTDAAVFRDGIWYLRQSTNGISIQQFGLANDKPVPAAFAP